MKKYSIIFFLIFLLIMQVNNEALVKAAEPSVAADSAVLIDAATGTVLYSKNMDTAYPPASTTKIMTALLTLEKSKFDDIVKVSKKVPFVDGSKIGLFEDEEIKVKDLLYGLILMSGNDCAEALAEHIGGSIEGFAKLMTERAKELGAENTNFVNPSGLYDENHKTSAKDLALIMREITKHAEFLEIASTFSYKVPPTNKHLEGIHLANENKLVNKNSMYYYPLAEAGKTGYTVKSLHSYVASASNNGQRLIVALIHDKEKKFYVDSKSLFEYGFNNFELKQLYKKDDVVTTYINEGLNIPLLAQDDYYYIKEKASTAEPKAEIINSPLQDKSFKKGDSIMEASIIFENKSLRNLKLVSGVDHEAKSTFGISFDSGDSSKNSGYTLQIFSAALVIVIIAVFGVIKYKHKK